MNGHWCCTTFLPNFGGLHSKILQAWVQKQGPLGVVLDPNFLKKNLDSNANPPFTSNTNRPTIIWTQDQNGHALNPNSILNASNHIVNSNHPEPTHHIFNCNAHEHLERGKPIWCPFLRPHLTTRHSKSHGCFHFTDRTNNLHQIYSLTPTTKLHFVWKRTKLQF